MKIKLLPKNIRLALMGDGRRTEIPALPATVGRVDADIVLPNPGISSPHAVLEVLRGHLVVRDLGSKNGTAVNGFRITDATPVRHGDSVAFGSVLFQISLQSSQVQPPHVRQSVTNNQTVMDKVAAPETPSRRPIQEVTVVACQDGKQRRFLLDKPIGIVGRRECDIVVRDPSLSRRHAQIEVLRDGFAVKDLASVNGTFIDGKRISYAEVKETVTFQAGSTTFYVFRAQR